MSALKSADSAEVLIIGAGPAGTALACLLADRGVAVVVLDRATFPRHKPCGECVNPGAVAALGRLGLLDTVLRLSPARLHGWEIRTEGGAVAHGRYAARAPHGLGISRSVLDAALVREARHRGARVCEDTRVTGLAADEEVRRDGRGVRRVETIDGKGRRRGFEGSLVVGADGIRSVVARRMGLLKRRPRIWKLSLTCRLSGAGPSRQHGSLFMSSLGTVGVAPVGAGTDLWNGTVVMTGRTAGRAVAADLLGGFRRALAAAPFPWQDGSPRIVAGPWACGPFDWPSRTAVGDGVLLVGDAAGYFDPLTGQGIYQALRSAELAAPVVAQAIRSGRTDAIHLTRYDRALRRELRFTRAIQHVVEFSLSRPTLRDALVSRLGSDHGRGFADRFVQVVGDAAPVGSLVSPDVLIPLLAGW